MHLYKKACRVVNTDPQRRCYNGCLFSSEIVWGEWEVLQHDVPPEQYKSRLKFWRELNDYAVQCRGKSARAEFKIE